MFLQSVSPPMPPPLRTSIESDYILIGIGVILSIWYFLESTAQKIPPYHSETDKKIEANPKRDIFYYKILIKRDISK